MTSHPSHRPISALRARMIEDMRVRGFTEKTRNDDIRNVRAFAAFIGRSPDAATAEDLRRFQLHQTQISAIPSRATGTTPSLQGNKDHLDAVIPRQVLSEIKQRYRSVLGRQVNQKV